MAKQKRDYQVIDSDGRVVLSRIDVQNDFEIVGAFNGFGWSGGSAPFRIYAAVVASGEGYGLVGEVAAGEARYFEDTGNAPDLEEAP